MNPSDEVSRHERIMQLRTLQANLECGFARIEMMLLEVAPKITPLVHEILVIRQAWDIEQRDAWAIAQRDPDAWLDRLVCAEVGV